MSEAPYVPFYTSDFLAGTSGMTAATKGVYITLLCLMYEAERPLSQQWDTLARRCGCTLPAFKKAISALQDDGKIAVINGEIWSEKCEKHIAQRRERRDSAASAAKKRWEKSKENQGKVDADAMRTQCQPEPEPEPERKNTSSRRASEHRFDEFWSCYPHRPTGREAKSKVREKYLKAVKSGVSEAELIDAAKRYSTLKQVKDGYGRGPLRWFNEKGWEDEISPPSGMERPSGPRGVQTGAFGFIPERC